MQPLLLGVIDKYLIPIWIGLFFMLYIEQYLLFFIRIVDHFCVICIVYTEPVSVITIDIINMYLNINLKCAGGFLLNSFSFFA